MSLMKKPTSILRLAVFTLSIGFACTACADNLEDGRAAIKAGNFEAAFVSFSKAAEQGDAKAQYNLAIMYVRGEGVGQDDKQAASWFRKAAEAGDAGAQLGLGSMYLAGQGVKKDVVQAHKWSNLAAANGQKEGAELRNSSEARMTPAQIAEAKKLASEWKPTVREGVK
jgi:hypothetical protein